MTDQGWFGIAVVLLLVALAAGFLRWQRVDLGSDSAGPVARFVLITTAIGGLLGAPFWWLDLPPSFAWDLPPIASRMLAAAALAFGIAGLMVLEHPSPGRTRLYLVLIATYIVPLALVAVALHVERFDFAAPVTYGFFAVVVVLSIGSLMTLTLSRGTTTFSAPVAMSAAVSAWLLVGGAILAVWGAALFAAPSTPFPLVFNWAQDPLTSRLIAAMLFTVGTAFLLSRNDLSRARLSLAFAATYGVGVMAACAMAAATAKPVPPLYAAGFAILTAVSLALLLTAAARRDGVVQAA